MNFLDFIKNLFSNGKTNTKLITKDLSKTFREKDRLEVSLTDKHNTPLTGKNVTIEINGVPYSRKTDDNGIAGLNINLSVGEYKALFTYGGDEEYNKSTAHCMVYVNAKVAVDDLNMNYHDGSRFTATLTDAEDKALPNTNVTFNINSVDYIRTTNNDGVAGLNINLNPGDYKISTKVADVNIVKNIHINKAATRMEGTDIVKTASQSSVYQCAVYDSSNNRVKGDVDITVNGKTYSRNIGDDGLARLNINLGKGEYDIKSYFKENNIYLPSNVVNRITVNDDPAPVEPQKSRSEKILDEFESYFGRCEYIDDALAKIQSAGYAFYFSDGYSMSETIRRMANGEGANCYDSAEVFYHLALGMNSKYGRNYEVQYLDVWCQVSGYDHIRLRLRSNGSDWFYRDPAAVLDGNGITYNWCSNGAILEVNPSWIIDG